MHDVYAYPPHSICISSDLRQPILVSMPNFSAESLRELVNCSAVIDWFTVCNEKREERKKQKKKKLKLRLFA